MHSLEMPSHAPPICSPVLPPEVLVSSVVVGVPDVVMLDGSSDVDGESVVVLSVVASPGLQAMTRIARAGMVNRMARNLARQAGQPQANVTLLCVSRRRV